MNVKTWRCLPVMAIAAGCLLPGADAVAQTKSAKENPLPLDTAVRTGKLANGFTYYIRHNEEPKNRVQLYLVNKVGSILETEDQRGLAHFIEHMSFNGTKHFPKNALVDYLQKSGVRFGADLNAYTSFDETVYQLPLPSDNNELLMNGFQIMRDWAQDATLDAAEIDKERGVILEEKRLRKGAQERMREKYWSKLLNHSLYAERMPIGIDTVLVHGKPETLRRFYHDWYRPDLQALIVVGDINVNEVEQIIKTRFATLVNPANEKKRTEYTIPLTGKNQFTLVTDAEMTSTVAEIMMKRKGQELQTAGDYRNAVIRQLFNQMLGQRYSELLKQAAPPFLQGGANVSEFLGGLDLFDVSVAVNTGELEKGVKAVWREIERAKRFGFTQPELERAKQEYLSNMASAWKEKNKTSSENYVKEYQQYFLKGVSAPGIDKEYELVKTMLPGIKVAEIDALIKAFVKDTDRDMLVLAPEKDKSSMPDSATLCSWLKAVELEKIEAYKDEVSDKPLLSAKPAAGTIVAEKVQPEVGVTEYTLSNGVKVILKPTAFKNDEIGFTSFAPGGTSVYSDADFASAANAAGIIASGGVGEYNSTALTKYLSGKQVQVGPYISERAQGVNGTTTPDELETALQLVYLYFTAPRKDEAMFQSIISRSKASLANRANDPNSIFADTVNAVLGNYSVRRTGPTVEKLDKINLDKAFTIYKERFADASGFTFVFVGSIDTTAIKPLLEQYLGALPVTHAKEDARDLGIHIPAGIIEKKVLKGKEAKATVRLVLSGAYTFSAENNSLLQALSEVLEIRLLERLREEEGGVYSPNASVSYGKYPHARYALTISFGCAPENVDKLVASAMDEIEQLKKNGPAAVNLDKYKAETRTSMQTALQSNQFWQAYLNNQYQNKESVTQILQQQQLLDKITVQGVQQAAKDYLKGDNFIRLVLLPETGK